MTWQEFIDIVCGGNDRWAPRQSDQEDASIVTYLLAHPLQGRKVS